MRTTVEIIDRTFTAKEAAAITGVAELTQRDWRRRNILDRGEPRRRVRYTVDDLIRLSIIKQLTGYGLLLSELSTVAKMAILPTRAGFLRVLNEAYAFDGDHWDDMSMERFWDAMHDGPDDQYLIVTKSHGGIAEISRSMSLGNLSGILAQSGSAGCVVIDCHRLAGLLVERFGGPLLTARIDRAADEMAPDRAGPEAC